MADQYQYVFAAYGIWIFAFAAYLIWLRRRDRGNRAALQRLNEGGASRQAGT